LYSFVFPAGSSQHQNQAHYHEYELFHIAFGIDVKQSGMTWSPDGQASNPDL
jgi:hypothetical protein